jgi:hypothetical protein
MSFQHNDEIYRSQMMVRYLSRSLDAEARDAFEDHYLSCQDCFEELRATELLILGLGQPIVGGVGKDGPRQWRHQSPDRSKPGQPHRQRRLGHVDELLSARCPERGHAQAPASQSTGPAGLGNDPHRHRR